MAFHVVQAQHSSPVVVVVAFVFLFHAAAQLILYHLKKTNKKHTAIDVVFKCLLQI